MVAFVTSLEKTSLRKLQLEGRCIGQLSIMGTICLRELSFNERKIHFVSRGGLTLLHLGLP